MYTVLVLSIIVVIIVLLLSIWTINKGYAYEQTIDKLEDYPLNNEQEMDEKKE